MVARPWRAVLEVWHPAVWTVYFVGVIALTMFGMAPACVVLSLAGGLCFSLATQGIASSLAKLRWQLPLLALICLINPLYSAMGSTLLGRVGPFRVYAESLAYGAMMGALLVAVLLWFEAAGSVVGVDETLELSGGLLPSIALAISMVMRLIPQLMRRGEETRRVTRIARGTGHVRSDMMRLLGVLLTWSLEDSVERSDSMRARGWGAAQRRSTYRAHRFRRRDGVALALNALLVAASAAGVGVTVRGWRFYPRMSGTAPLWTLVPFVLLVLVPTFMLVADRMRGE